MRGSTGRDITPITAAGTISWTRKAWATCFADALEFRQKRRTRPISRPFMKATSRRTGGRLSMRCRTWRRKSAVVSNGPLHRKQGCAAIQAGPDERFVPLAGSYSDDRPQSRPDDCSRNRPRADQFANWSGLDSSQPSEVWQTRGANRRSPLARTSRCWEVRRKPGIASHHETYLLRVLAYLQEYDIILSEP